MMYNAQNPNNNELPTAGQLVRSTLLALVAAMVLLVTVVMPSEYAIDPTGVGRMLGLTQMGEIKEQLADEAEADRQRAAQQAQTVAAAPAVVTPAPVVPAKPVAPAAPVETRAPDSNEISVVLVPGQGAEVKLEMKEGAMVRSNWTANGGKLNYDTHGDPYNPPEGFYHGYGKGRFLPGDKGMLKAAFDGKHGWFWRNRTRENVTMTLTVEGDYIKMQRVL